MNIYQLTGKKAIGSRLRKLSETFTEDARKVYALYGLDFEPKWFPVFFLLMENKQMFITDIAQMIQHTHASVSQIVKDMKKKGIVKEEKDSRDGRKTLISLTEKGKDILTPLQSQLIDVQETVEELLSQMDHDLWKAIEETEYLLNQKSLYERVKVRKKERDSQEASIIDYQPQYKNDFRQLNEEWIKAFFKLEEQDVKVLNEPESYILEKGGHIFFAVLNDKIVGTCALIKLEEDYFELAKMAVAPEARGKNIGWLLGQAIVRKARSLNAKRLYLESNTLLVPAIQLYQKLGFKKINSKSTSPYQRSNIQMEMEL